METTVLKVEGMSCEHCKKAVTGAVTSVSGVNRVAVDLDAKTVSVDYDSANALGAIKAAITEEGYEVVS